MTNLNVEGNSQETTNQKSVETKTISLHDEFFVIVQNALIAEATDDLNKYQRIYNEKIAQLTASAEAHPLPSIRSAIIQKGIREKNSDSDAYPKEWTLSDLAKKIVEASEKIKTPANITQLSLNFVRSKRFVDLMTIALRKRSSELAQIPDKNIREEEAKIITYLDSFQAFIEQLSSNGEKAVITLDELKNSDLFKHLLGAFINAGQRAMDFFDDIDLKTVDLVNTEKYKTAYNSAGVAAARSAVEYFGEPPSALRRKLREELGLSPDAVLTRLDYNNDKDQKKVSQEMPDLMETLGKYVKNLRKMRSGEAVPENNLKTTSILIRLANTAWKTCAVERTAIGNENRIERDVYRVFDGILDVNFTELEIYKDILNIDQGLEQLEQPKQPL